MLAVAAKVEEAHVVEIKFDISDLVDTIGGLAVRTRDIVYVWNRLIELDERSDVVFVRISIILELFLADTNAAIL